MPKRREPAMNNAIARDIFNELDLYAKDRQFYPVEHALFGYMTALTRQLDGSYERRYKLSKGEFRYWFSRLVEEGHIKVDPETRAIRCVHLMIVEKDSYSP